MRLIAASMCLACFFVASSVVSAAEPAVDPVATVVSGAPVLPFRKLSIQYAVRDTTGGLQKVELFGTTDMGKTWHRWGDDPDKKSPVVVSVPQDGVYGFAIVSTDRVGNRERPPENGMIPQIVVVVDTEKPTGTFTAPVTRQMMPEDGIVLSWKTEDAHPAENPVKLEFSTNNGTSWKRLRGSYPATGAVRWKPAQANVSSYIFRLRVGDRANNENLISAPGMVLVDSIAPQAKITGPQSARSSTVSITYDAEDNVGGLGVDWVELWTSVDEGNSWQLHGRAKAPSLPISYTAKGVNRVGFRLRAGDAAGNAMPPPSVGMAPELTLAFDSTGPQITMEPLPRMIGGGSDVTIAWTADDANPADEAVTIAWSADGAQTWETIATGQPSKGSIAWKTPENVGVLNNCLVRIIAADALGNVSTVMTPAPFTITTRLPETIGGGISGTSIILDGETPPARRTDADVIETENEGIIAPVPLIPDNTRRPRDMDTTPEADALSRQPLVPITMPSDLYNDGHDEETTPRGMDVTPVTTRRDAPRVDVPTATITSVPDTMSTPTTKIDEPIGRFVDAETPHAEKTVMETPVTGNVERGFGTSPDSTDVVERKVVETPIEKVPDVMSTLVVPDATTGTITETPKETSRDVATTNESLSTVRAAASPATPTMVSVPISTDPASDDDSPRVQADLLGREALGLIEEENFALARLKVADALKLDDKSSVTHLALAKVLAAEGDLAKAQDEAQKAVTLDEGYAGAFLFHGDLSFTRCKASAKQIAEGQEAGADAADLQPYRQEFDRHLRDAIASYRRAVELDATNKDGYDKLGEVHYYKARATIEAADQQRAYFDAISWFKKGYDIGIPTYSEAFHLGKIHYAQDQLEPAARYFLKGIDVCPAGREPRECYWYLAEIEEKRKSFDNAIHYWQRASKGYEDTPAYAREAADRARQLEKMLEDR